MYQEYMKYAAPFTSFHIFRENYNKVDKCMAANGMTANAQLSYKHENVFKSSLHMRAHMGNKVNANCCRNANIINETVRWLNSR